MSLVLVLNAGSSSLKYKLLEKSTLNVLAKGNVQDIGSDTKSTISCVVDGRESNKNVDVTDHKLAINELIDHLVDPDQEPKVVKRKEDIVLIGHRVVHGGEQSKPLVIDSKSLRQIDELTELAPLHNHSSVQVIRHCLKIMPHAKNVACFDTIFHRSLPPHVYTYAIPYETTEKKHIRKYGFHGLSYEYITNAASDYLKGKPEDFKFVALHLGSGASICAIRHGQSLDTSMGMTPLEGIAMICRLLDSNQHLLTPSHDLGLMMGTRSGDMDPSVVFHLAHKEEMTNEAPGIEGERFHLTKAEYILNHQSGLKGVAGTSDIREILQLRAQGDGKKSDRARLALEMYVYRAKKYIGAYFAALNGVDAILLCGGVGEKSQEVREGICADLESMGIRLEKSKNREVEERFHNGETVADIGGGKVRILVIQTDEEMQIARTLSAM